MRLLNYFLSILFLILLIQCTSVDNAIREKDRFSSAKKYAILPFKCADKETGNVLSKELCDKLLDFGFTIISHDDLQKIISEHRLTEEKIMDNYNIALNNMSGVDAIIVGNITMEKSLSNGGAMGSYGTGGMINYINVCDVYCVDIKTSEILASASYKAPYLSSNSTSIAPSSIADKLARMLSPH